MKDDRNGIVRGLFLGFSKLRTCAERVKALGIRPPSIFVLLPDGSVVPASAVEFLQRRSEGAARDGQNEHQASSAALTRALLSVGLPAYIAEGLEVKMKNGGVLLFVRCECHVLEKLEEVFVETGAEDVSSVPDRERPMDAFRSGSANPISYGSRSISAWSDRV